MKVHKVSSSSSYFNRLVRSLFRFTSCSTHLVSAAETRPATSEKIFTGSYSFKFTGYSVEELNRTERIMASTILNVGGYDWSLVYYPKIIGNSARKEESVFLYLRSKADNVKAQLTFRILNKDGREICPSLTTDRYTFSNDTMKVDWGFSCLVNKPYYVTCHAIACIVTVVRDSPVESAVQLVVPPSDVQHQLGHLLETGNGADVIFEVKGQKFSGHKCILGARSPVFAAEFFGLMKEKLDTIIRIEEIEAPVFKALLHFIYNDSFPGFEGIKGSYEKHDTKVMAHHLLVAADRYGLERLKIICEKISCGSIDVSNVVTLLSLAERHSCNHLRTACLKFLASPETIGEVAGTEEFQCLVRSRPLILKDLLVEQGQK